MSFGSVSQILNKVSSFMKLSQAELAVLSSFDRIKKSTISIEGKDHHAWRIVHSNALGPGKGGIRFHPTISKNEVKSLAFWMSIKNSLTGLPFGGAKGGVKVDPKMLTKDQLEEISRSYIRRFHEFLGEDKDIPAPDVYTNPRIMSWMLDEYEKIKGRHEPGMITGKPVILGGCELRSDATARGGFIIFKELISKLKKKDLTIAIQGFGNVGYNFAKIAYDNGFKVVAVGDSKGGIFDPDGLNIHEVKETKDKKGSVIEHSAKEITNKELLEKDVDFLVLAALEDQITKKNADKIKASQIIELANGPVTPEADKVLSEKDISVIPDVLANSGGVLGSYFEWMQNKTGNFFKVCDLRDRFEEIMKENFYKVYDFSLEKDIDMRTAAYLKAIKRILEAESARGKI